jgi:hypothetical protein
MADKQPCGYMARFSECYSSLAKQLPNSEAQMPEYVVGELVAATDTCVSVGTQADVDGETEVTLCLGGPDHVGLTSVFDGRLSTPGGVVSIETSQSDSLAHLAVDRKHVRVSIWVDDHK